MIAKLGLPRFLSMVFWAEYAEDPCQGSRYCSWR